MSEVMNDLLAAAVGTRLNQSRYQRDFDANLWRVDGADSWKLERMQNYSEIGFPSWEAFMAGQDFLRRALRIEIDDPGWGERVEGSRGRRWQRRRAR